MSDFAEGYAVGVGNNQGYCYPYGGMGYGGGFGGLGGDWLAILVLFALFGNGGWGGNGIGNNNQLGYELGRVATTNDVASGFSTSTIMSTQRDLQLGQTQGFADVQQTLCQGFSGVNATVNQVGNSINQGICNLGYTVQGGFNDISRQISDCCCQTQRAIDGVNYNLATQSCETRRAIEDSTNRVIGFLTNQQMDALRAENAQLTAQLSNNAQTERIINRLSPCPIPAYPACPPTGPYNWQTWGGNNCGCGC